MKKNNLLFHVFALFALQILFASAAYSQTNDKFKQSRNAIPNRYIVVLSKDVSSQDFFPPNVKDEKVRKSSSELALQYGGRIERLYSRAIRGYSVEMSREQAIRLSQDPRVDFVEEDYVIYKDQTQNSAPTGLDRIDQRNLPLNSIYNYTSTGAGVHAYVIDSGIRATHTEFTGRIGNGQDFVNDGQGTNDCDGHGTHVAGILGGTTYGVAKNVTLHPLRIFNCEGKSTGSGSLAAVDWITANRVPNAPGVVNMSLGGGYSSSNNTAIANSIAQTGLTYVVSAGNENNDACDKSPASTPEAITVGSSSPTTDSRSSFSNYGVCVDVFAPGSSISSAWFTSDTAAATISGTSMAAPHVSGIVARFLQGNPNATPSQVQNSVINSATNGIVNNPGVGSPNRLAFADVVFNNTAPLPPIPGPAPAVRIPEQGTGTPYPAEYIVSGGPTFIGNVGGSVIVNINGFSHTATGEVSFLLEGPTGAKILLQSGVGLNEDANNISYTFRDDGLPMLENSAIVGSQHYRPTAYDLINFPTPGPGTNYNNPGPNFTTNLGATFGGTNSNGTWKLYVKDENLGDRGRIDNWSVTFNAPVPPTAPTGLVAHSARTDGMNISWDTSPPNQSIVSYNLRMNGGTLINIINNPNSSRISYIPEGLSPATAYTVEVQAVSGTGATSSFSTTNAATLPTQPTNFQANAVSTNQINLSWVAPAGQNIASYNLRIVGGQPITGITSTNYSATGLLPSTFYSFEVQAVSAVGTVSTWSNVSVVTLSSGITLSASPSTVAPNGVATANWTAQSSRPGTDWIGVYQVGAANSSLFAWQYVTAGTSGLNSFQMPSSPGTYEFRYFTDNSFILAASSQVTVAAQAATITVFSSPTSVAPNGVATANWIAQGSRPGTDWIGVYQVGAPNSSLFAWQYVTAGTSGSNSFQMPSSPGTYEFRYFTNNSYNLAASSQVTVAPQAATVTLSSSPTSVAPNGAATANWTASSSRPGNDWIGLYQVGAPNNSLFAWQYVTPGISGSSNFQMPSSPGTYEFRYFTENSFNMAASSQVTVAAQAATITLSSFPTSVAPNGAASANWTASSSRPGTDWIGVYQVGAPNNSLFAWQYVTPGTSGSNSFQMPSSPGTYEFRYFTDNSYNLAASSQVIVGGSQSATLRIGPTRAISPNLIPIPTLNLTPVSISTVSFVSFDLTTQGSWRNNYGGQGDIIIREVGVPSFVLWSFGNGQSRRRI